jgi:hypothetical protein
MIVPSKIVVCSLKLVKLLCGEYTGEFRLPCGEYIEEFDSPVMNTP